MKQDILNTLFFSFPPPWEIFPFNLELMGIGEASYYSLPLQEEHTNLISDQQISPRIRDIKYW